MKKKIFYGIAILLVVIQFIRPAKNIGEVYTSNDLSHAVNVPDDVKNILEKACNDCHSNNTVYPWYTNIQPFGWWIGHHVDEGKGEVNFSEFNNYKLRRKLRKLDEIADQVKEGEMPLNSYTWIHKNAILTAAEKEILLNWAITAKASIDTVKIAAQPK